MTRKMMLIAGAATMALAAPATAGPKGGGHGQHAEQDRGGGNGGGGQKARPDRSGGGEMRQMQRAQRGGGEMRQMQRAERGGAREMRQMQRAERGGEMRRADRSTPRFERQQTRRMERQVERNIRPMRMERQAMERRVERASRPMRVEQRMDRREVERRAFAPRFDDRREALRQRAFDDRRDYRADSGFKNFGQEVSARAHLRNELRKERREEWKLGQQMDRRWAEQANWMPLRYASRYQDTPDWTYRYDGDRIYRVNRSDGMIGGIIPLLGGAYSVGQPMPGYYSSSYVPLGYRSLYYDTPDYYYRYGDGGLYQVNADNGVINSLVALLTGTNLGIGQMLPSAYNTYNVPYDYRSQYYDTPDAWYRYNNGYIYQVDPYSRMIQSSYPLYGNGYYDVGQQWPTAYPSYNVPDYYQSAYYDTPQWDYRYANGAIYQVDPQNQMINALVSLVTGSPMNVGQMMPSGYGVYNVPLQYRSQYYDTADNWYRYGDGNIYRVDPYSGRVAEVIPTYV